MFGPVWPRVVIDTAASLSSLQSTSIILPSSSVMVHSSRRPLTTYSRRRAHHRQSTQDASQSSPIKPLSPDTEDVSFALMAQRMNKRARLAAHSSINDTDTLITLADGEKDERPVKRAKSLVADRSRLSLDGNRLEAHYMLEDFARFGPTLQTPLQCFPSDHSMEVSSAFDPTTAPDQLSPPPVAKRIITRTSSRNFKENAGPSTSRRPLASPFSSRPGSRASSPHKHAKIKPGRHTKSRTLSQSGALKEKAFDRNTSQYTQVPHHTKTRIGPNVTLPRLPPAHTRTSSIPTPQPPLDHISSGHWLIPAKALSRPIQQADSDGEGDIPHDTTDTDHGSFFRDAPIQASTPPRRQRSATIGIWARGLMPQIDADPPPPVRSFPYDSDVDMTDSSRPGSPSDSRSSRGNPPRRRRRTIVHLPSDSLFSSSLDFSALMSDTERFPRPPASEGSRSPEPNLIGVNSDLAPAFSLQNSPLHADTQLDAPVIAASSGSSGSCAIATGTVHEEAGLPRPPPSSPSSGPPGVGIIPEVDGDELLDLFSVLGLDGQIAEDQKWDSFTSVDDSGVAFPEPSAPSCPPSANGGRVRRKRGDTIRASDFAQVPLSASFDSGAASSLAGGLRVPPRRTRSGTVTQASSSGGGRRKHEGWPTIRMRTTAEPLRVDGDETDDELLLKTGDFMS
ncbi:hypothetical protein ONZ51_g1746 [Trametes cubensis]|uniref:Uncharacterized protein n=1 Tax=Trametes cubensis TaxID=1111947 RepID=A0AAD7U0W9_9APHY|nr:hypothetical protein ONZ51_g1746 [Trametes cubensis]